MQTSLDSRPSPIAGRWYPGDARRLAESVDHYIQSAQMPMLAGEIVAVIAPHAGYPYSGAVAGYAYAAMRQAVQKGARSEIVVVVAPSHYPYPYPLLTTTHGAYETPLGIVPVDNAALERVDTELKKSLGFGLGRVARDEEHSLEIELPFLQRVLPGAFSLLPVMVRDLRRPTLWALGQALAHVLEERACLLVASTDLSHFYSQAEASLLDAEMLRRIESFDPDAILRAEDEGKGYACGRGAVAAVLWASQALGANQTKVLRYATSAEVTHDFSQVVGYGAAVVMKT
jgi:hypothetical protein